MLVLIYGILDSLGAAIGIIIAIAAIAGQDLSNLVGGSDWH
ncbi:MAG: hypothetical protein QGF23_01815 [Dehalococcoidales bacterium]|nr:hypothetical protein [Dehalococcoidales bacterium]